MTGRAVRRVQEPKSGWHLLQSLFFIFILALAAFFFLQSSFFRVSKIEVNNLKQLTREQIISLSGLTAGVNIFKADLKQAHSKVVLNPLVSKVEITRKLPRTIVIDITERKPLALIPDKGSFAIVGEDGFCLALTKNLNTVNMPIMTGVNPKGVVPGKKIPDEKINTALDFMLTMSLNLRASISEINLTDLNNVRIYTIDGTEIKFGDDSRIAEKIKLYGEVIGQNYKNKIQYIDISYEGNPVIKFVGDPVNNTTKEKNDTE